MKNVCLRFFRSFARAALAACLLWLVALPAQAANYVFPGNMPRGCSGSGGVYTCSSLSLNYQDTITIASPTPATITVRGNFSTNQNQINTGGAASNLTLKVTGDLDLNWGSSLNANVTARSITGGSGVTFGGNVASTDGDIIIYSGAHVLGSITSNSGDIGLASSVTVDGNVETAGEIYVGYAGRIAGSITSRSDAVELGSSVTVGGSISAADNAIIGHQGYVAGEVKSTDGDVEVESSAMVGSIVTLSEGDVTVGWAAVVCGDVTTNEGDIELGVSVKVGGNVKSIDGDITVLWGAHVRGSVSTGGDIENNSGGKIVNPGLVMPPACSAVPPGGTPSGFNAFETSTAAGAVTGVIKTKVAGATSTLAVVALTATPSVKADFQGTVALELVVGGGTTACADRTRINSIGSLDFAAADQGRKNISFVESNAWQNVLVRMTYTPTSGSKTVACSTDAFAIRPSYLAVAVTEGDWETAGTARNLDNASVPGGTLHKAGRPFTIRATAYNAANAITTNYDGVPTPVITAYLLPNTGCATCVLNGGTFSASGGTVTSTTATFNEVGAFRLQMQDAQFAAIDAADSSIAERTIASAEINVGRFIPDHFTLLAGSEVTAACGGAGGFTYMSQPSMTVKYEIEAQAYGGNKTRNYSYTANDNLARSVVTVVAENADGGVNLNLPERLVLSATSWVSGSYVVSVNNASFNRLAVPDGPYDSLQLGVRVVDADGPVLAGLDMNAGTTGACDPATSCDSKKIGDATKVRFGRLRLTNAYGSPKISLPIPMRAEYFNGTTFVTNTLDNCTAVAAENIAMPAYSGGVTSANMTVARNVTAGGTFAAGIGRLALLPPNPTAAKKGSVDVCVDLGQDVPVAPARCVATTPLALPWLKGRWTGNGYDDDPKSRATFGVYKNSLGRGSEMIYFREMY